MVLVRLVPVRRVDTVLLKTAVVALLLISSTGVSGAAWPIAFDEVSHEAGMEFRTAGEMHDPEELDDVWPALPEIAGAGACWVDFDSDGYEDLYIANQRYNEKNPYAAGYNDLFDPTNRLYLNNGNGTFTDATKRAGVESRGFDYGCSGADHDGDGHVDLLVYGFGHLKLFRNEGDTTFTDVTSQAGLDISTKCLPYECMNTCGSWTDYDGDGWLDLFVCTFVETDMEDAQRGPGGHTAQLNFLFKNNGDGTFAEVAEQAGVEGIAADNVGSKSWAAVWFDADLDGWPDLFVANDMTPNEFYWNNGNGTFTRDDDAGLYDDRAGMGVAIADTTQDGYPDLYFTHYAFQNNGYFENKGTGKFSDRSGDNGLGTDWERVGWGAGLVDLDRDGRLDIMAVNGHTEWVLQDYDQPTLVYQQGPEGEETQWVDVSDDSGAAVAEERVSRGAAFADYDLDGNMDLAVMNNANQTMQLLKGSGVDNHWLYVQPVQAGGNHHAVGARVIVETGATTQSREIQAGASFLSQNTLLADFGLGDATVVDRLTIHWPHGNTTVLEDLPVDRVVRVDRETGSYQTDTLTPRTTALFNGQEDGDRWFASAIDIKLLAEDRAVGPASGLHWTEYRLDSGDWTRYGGETFQFPEEEGNHTLRFRSVDHAGNRESVRTERFGVDLAPPVAAHRVEGTPASNGWWLDAQVHLEAQDDLSGMDRVEYRVDGGFLGNWKLYEQPVAIEDGVHVIEYKATDLAGNEAPVRNVTVKVDATPPELSWVRPDWGRVYYGDEEVAQLGAGTPLVVASPEALDPEGGDFTVRLDASDASSGVKRVDLWVNDEHVARILDPDDEVAWVWDTSTYAAGTYLLQAVVQDGAGNVESGGRSVMLVPTSQEGLGNTVLGGPSLYPFAPGSWPV